MNLFMKILSKKGERLKFTFSDKLYDLTEAKFEKKVFVGSDIRKLMKKKMEIKCWDTDKFSSLQE